MEAVRTMCLCMYLCIIYVFVVVMALSTHFTWYCIWSRLDDAMRSPEIVSGDWLVNWSCFRRLGWRLPCQGMRKQLTYQCLKPYSIHLGFFTLLTNYVNRIDISYKNLSIASLIIWRNLTWLHSFINIIYSNNTLFE